MIGPQSLENAQEKGGRKEGRKEGRKGEGLNCVNPPPFIMPVDGLK